MSKNDYRTEQKIVVSVLLAAVLLAGCSAESLGSFSQIGASALNMAGVNVSAEDINVAASAGGKLVKAARGLTEEQEYYLGRGVSAVVLRKYRALNNGPLNQYVNKVGRVVAAFSERPETFGGYHFLVLDTPEVNALSAPGGFIFISRGFLRVIPDEDALAAVLAHEVAHVVKGHGTAAISQANMTEALTLIGKQAAASQGSQAVQLLTDSFGDSIKDITDTLLTKGYSRSQEYDADAYAAKLLAAAGYDQQALVAMLQGLGRADASSAGGGWLSTHPAAEDREGKIARRIEAPDPETVAGRALRAGRYQHALRGV